MPHSPRLAQIYSDQIEFGHTIWTVISQLTHCEAQYHSSGLPSIDEDLLQTFLLVFTIDLKDANSVMKLIDWVRGNRKRIPMTKIIVVAENKSLDLESIEMETLLIKGGIYEVLDRPLNLRRFRYVVETVKANHDYANSKSGIVDQPNFPCQMLSTIEKIKNFDTNIFLTGETGVGKSYWAKKIHDSSTRRKNAFVALNCANYTESLAQSELFGHVKGAFTGAASDHQGLLEVVGNGTIFLDETDSLQLSVQAKLLHVIEEKNFRKLGGRELIPMQGRVICASNQRLDDLVANGSFRSDLFYRLNAYEINIPSLRHRTDEIDSLCRYFADEVAKSHGQKSMAFNSETMDLLRDYPWPGNIRELKNCIQHCAIESAFGSVKIEHLPKRILQFLEECDSGSNVGRRLASEPTRKNAIEKSKIEKRKQLIEALSRNGFNRKKAAVELGVSRMTVYNLMRSFELV